jgi:T5orf172 domain
MKGWVYVITNKAMLDLVKVGFSTKDPSLRALELNNTGSPHPYEVQYTMLIEEPYEVEQQTHRRLTKQKEGKEWFRCTIEDAIAAIKH